MNTLYLRTSRDDSSRFARADRRGPLGRGRCYGYDVVLERDPAGERVRGQRQINRHQAANRVPRFRCLRRQKPEAHCFRSQCEGVPGPDGVAWCPTTINGTARAAPASSTTSSISVGWFGLRGRCLRAASFLRRPRRRRSQLVKPPPRMLKFVVVVVIAFTHGCCPLDRKSVV